MKHLTFILLALSGVVSQSAADPIEPCQLVSTRERAANPNWISQQPGFSFDHALLFQDGRPRIKTEAGKNWKQTGKFDSPLFASFEEAEADLECVVRNHADQLKSRVSAQNGRTLNEETAMPDMFFSFKDHQGNIVEGFHDQLRLHVTSQTGLNADSIRIKSLNVVTHYPDPNQLQKKTHQWTMELEWAVDTQVKSAYFAYDRKTRKILDARTLQNN
ncbi:MAG: hypothetical protein AB7P04_04295 [Bacteriovoracia bacterium]